MEFVKNLQSFFQSCNKSVIDRDRLLLTGTVSYWPGPSLIDQDRTGRISALSLFCMDRAVLGPYYQDFGPIFSQYGPRAWLMRYMNRFFKFLFEGCQRWRTSCKALDLDKKQKIVHYLFYVRECERSLYALYSGRWFGYFLWIIVSNILGRIEFLNWNTKRPSCNVHMKIMKFKQVKFLKNRVCVSTIIRLVHYSDYMFL